MTEPVLVVEDLMVEFATSGDPLVAVDGVSFTVAEDEVMAIVGESGSGKSVTALAILGLLPNAAEIVSGSIRFGGKELTRMGERDLRRIRGAEIAMVFQEPTSSLNPLLKVGAQISEAVRAHASVSRGDASKQAVDLLRTVQVPAPERRSREYPHQFSGGMAQRVAIAMALANRPRLLIADEPTTALDVTVQAQVLKSLREAQRAVRSAMILITHDMGLVAETADRVTVMYAGAVVESGSVETVLRTPTHPYTQGLLRSLPRVEVESAQRLVPIPGQPRQHHSSDVGCPFVDRCELTAGRAVCRETRPRLELRPNGSFSACHFASEMAAK